MSLIQWIDFRPIADDRGTLVAVEGNRSVPFEIKRVYYLYGTDAAARRGYHAHKTLKQVAICVAGNCRFVLDDAAGRAETVLDRPDRGLLVDLMVWHEMYEFSPDCILLMLASDHYDETDYIRDYEEFQRRTATTEPAGKPTRSA